MKRFCHIFVFFVRGHFIIFLLIFVSHPSCCLLVICVVQPTRSWPQFSLWKKRSIMIWRCVCVCVEGGGGRWHGCKLAALVSPFRVSHWWKCDRSRIIMSLPDRPLPVHTVYVAYSCIPLCAPSSKQSPPCDAAELLSKENRWTKKARGCRPPFDSRRGPWLHIVPPLCPSSQQVCLWVKRQTVSLKNKRSETATKNGSETSSRIENKRRSRFIVTISCCF